MPEWIMIDEKLTTKGSERPAKKDGIVHEEKERKLIQRAYRKLLRSIKSEMDETDRVMIRNAYEVAVQAHSQQRRKSGEPYILHPIEVARICAEEIGLGPTAIIGALLHDVVEDTDITLSDIKERFGTNIAKIVDGLTKLDASFNVESPQAENFRKVLRTLVEDVRIVLIKMADRLHNMRTLGSMPQHKQLRIAAETSYIYAPLAHRLGLYNIKTEYQDLCMKVTNPEEYREIARKLQETKRERSAFIQGFIEPLKEALGQLRVPFRITGRPKSIYSISNKIRTKKVAFEEIYDLFAIRVILDVPRQMEREYCWRAYSIVTDVHRPIPERLKDWVTTPKSNGYSSLHTTVIGPKGRYVEVQIRTERMDEIAERGFAAHWKYKGGADQPDVYDDWLDSVREVLENKEADAVEFLSDFKSGLFKNEVFVYTPNGDLKVLPEGASALDFAFSIHSELGSRCKSVRINKIVKPLGYKVQNGDQIEIITDKNQKPTEGWLKLVVTGKARSKIRSSMREERRKQGEYGKEALVRKLRNMKAGFEENVDMLVRYYELENRPDLYYGIAMEEINLQDLSQKFTLDGQTLTEIAEPTEKIPVVEEPRTGKLTRKAKKQASFKPRLMINDQPANQFHYTLANCCNPVQGDEVFAYITANNGMKIHRSDCSNGLQLMARYGYRVMKAEWVHAPDSSFVADIYITGVDDGPGVIKQLSEQISNKLGLNIRSFYIDGGEEGYFEGRISIVVSNTNQISHAIQVLKELPQVHTAERRSQEN